jgi:hypothetical protein
LAITNVTTSTQPVNGLRQRCPVCFARFPLPIEALSLGKPIACRRCHVVSPLSVEPPDDRWWAYICGQEIETRVALGPEPKRYERHEPVNGHHDERDLLVKVLG